MQLGMIGLGRMGANMVPRLIRGLSRVVSRSLPLLLSAAFPAASFAVQTGAVRTEQAGSAPADLFEVAVQDTVTVVPGARYRAGWMKRWLAGDHYRALWTTRLPVPVLENTSVSRGVSGTRGAFTSRALSLMLNAGEGSLNRNDPATSHELNAPFILVALYSAPNGHVILRRGVDRPTSSGRWQVAHPDLGPSFSMIPMSQGQDK